MTYGVMGNFYIYKKGLEKSNEKSTSNLAYGFSPFVAYRLIDLLHRHFFSFLSLKSKMASST